MQEPPGLRARLNTPFFHSLALFLIALITRVAAIGRYVTPDEPIWVFRSIGFREALLTGDWASTIQSGHPGVTLTWLGTIAVQLQLWLQPQSREHLTWLNQLYWLTPENGAAFQHLAVFLTAARLGPIILTSLGIVAIYWLTRARFGASTAILGAVLLLGDPFTVGLSGLFHLDALLATLMLLAVLILLPKSEQAPTLIGRRETLLSGLFTALAILTKTPGLFLLPFIFLIILWRTLRVSADLPFSTRLRRLPTPLLLWGGAILIVILLLLPAVWAAPVAVFETVGGLTNRLVDSAVRPIFFLGQETLNPGPTFYPLVLVFRLAPVVCMGLLLSAVFAVRQLGKSLNSNLLWLLLFSLGFLFFLNLSAKRFDRYALPAILPLILISAAGLKALFDRIQSLQRAGIILLTLIIVHMVYYNLSSPYPLTAYNWFAGGSAVAKKVFTTDWGEETSALAKSLGDFHPDSSTETLFTSNIPAAAAFYPGPLLPLNAQTLTRLQNGDFVHLLPQDLQAAASETENPTAYDLAVQHLILEQNIADLSEDQLFSDLEPADFMLPAFQSSPQQIHFGEQLAVRFAGALPAAWPNRILIGITWERLQTAETDYFFRLELVDEAGEIWLTNENILLNGVDHPARYWPANQAQEVFYTLTPPSDLAPGTYTVQATLFDEQGARLGVFTDDGRFAGVVAPLAELSIPAPVTQLPPDPPNPLPEETELIGYDAPPAAVGTGESLKLDLWWRQTVQTPPSGRLALLIGNETAETTLITNGWLPGQYYHIRPVWRVPVGLTSGSYPLSLQWFDANGRPQWPAPIEIGQIEIIARPRAFDLPADITPLEIQLGTIALLQQATAEVTDGLIYVNVVWQAVESDGVFYTTFLHLLDESGVTVTQGDRPSLEPTNAWVAGQVIQEQYQLTRPPSGRYTIAIGLYNAANGLRLPIYAADGAPLPDDQYLIEVVVP